MNLTVIFVASLAVLAGGAGALMHLIARYHDGEQTDPRGLAICLAAFCVGITFLTAAL